MLSSNQFGKPYLSTKSLFWFCFKNYPPTTYAKVLIPLTKKSLNVQTPCGNGIFTISKENGPILDEYIDARA